ncbi:MAG: hypothetical protein ACI9SE_004312 [Neolewinella sp.]|jgi:hypothetical protein
MMTRLPGLLVMFVLLTMVGVASSQSIPAEQLVAKKAYRGLVLDESGDPLAGVAVCSVPDEPDWLPDTLVAASKVRTDAFGRFVLEVDGDQVSKALFVARGRVRLLQSLELLAMWPVQMAKAGALAGQVRGQDGQPVAGARILAEDHLRGLPFIEDKARGNTQAWLQSVAVTDSRGRFLLRGVYDTAVRLSVSAIGYHDLEVGPVSKLEPLSLNLTKVPGTITGVVLDPSGAPAVRVKVRSYLQQGLRTSSTVMTNDEGRFRSNYYGGPTRLYVSAMIAGARTYGRHDVTEPGTCELRLAPHNEQVSRAREFPSADLLKPKKQLRVTAKTAGGKPCPAFRVAVYQIDAGQHKYRTDRRQLEWFEGSAVASEDGIAVAPVYKGYGENAWLVLATAKGCASVRLQIDAGAEELQLEFAKAAPVRGTVVDARTGKPVVGVRAWFLLDLDGKNRHHRKFDELKGDAFCVRTNVEGAFVLDDAPIGPGRVFFTADGYEPTWRPFEVGGNDEPLQIAFEPLVPLPGQMECSRLLRHLVAVRTLRNLPGGSSEDFADLSGAVPVAATGGFRLPQQSVGARHFEALVQRSPRQGRPDKVIVGELSLNHDTTEITLDASAAVPLRIRGKVTGPVPFQRLAVLCAPLPQRNMHYGYLQYRGPLCALAIDGTYDLQALPGKRILAVIDIESGVMFARMDVELLTGADQQQDIRIDGLEVTVRIEADTEARQLGDFYLEFVPKQDYWPGGIAQISGSLARISEHCKGMGVRVPAASVEAKLWVPRTSGQLGLRRFARHHSGQANGVAHGVRSIDAAQDRVVTLTW